MVKRKYIAGNTRGSIQLMNDIQHTNVSDTPASALKLHREKFAFEAEFVYELVPRMYVRGNKKVKLAEEVQ